MAAAVSSVPPFFSYAVIPVARKLWLPTLVAIPAARVRFWTQLLERVKGKTKLHSNTSPKPQNWISAGAGRSGLSWNYVVRQHDTRVELYLWEQRPEATALSAVRPTAPRFRLLPPPRSQSTVFFTVFFLAPVRHHVRVFPDPSTPTCSATRRATARERTHSPMGFSAATVAAPRSSPRAVPSRCRHRTLAAPRSPLWFSVSSLTAPRRSLHRS